MIKLAPQLIAKISANPDAAALLASSSVGDSISESSLKLIVDAMRSPQRRAEIDLARAIDSAAKRSEGMGDSIAKLAAAVGADRLAKLYEKWTGKSCGCGNRQKWLNEHWPYKPTAPSPASH